MSEPDIEGEEPQVAGNSAVDEGQRRRRETKKAVDEAIKALERRHIQQETRTGAV